MNPVGLIFKRLADALIARAIRRPPDFVIGGHDKPYLLRWWLLPRNRAFNVYVHMFLRDDDDRALHDHPWFWLSWILRGGYVEHTIAHGGVRHRAVRSAGSVRMASPWRAHRIELFDERLTLADYDGDVEAWRAAPRNKQVCWTLFITGPRVREWGFHCPERGWVNWRDFTAADDRGAIGRGCDA